MFNFSDMLAQYQQSIKIITEADGYWDTNTGQWVEGTLTEVETNAPILPVSPDDLKFDDLTYNTSDRKMYYHSDIDIGAKVEINNVEFSVMQKRDYSHHASGLRIYILRRSDAGD